VLWACLVGFAGWGCSGIVETPEPAPARNRAGAGGITSTPGNAPTGGRAGVSGGVDAGAGGRSGASGEGGNAGTGDGPGHDEPDAGDLVTPPAHVYCDAVNTVFRPTCGNGSCHTNEGAVIGDFGVSAEKAASYVGRGSVRDTDCGLIINPVEPQQSLILTKVTGGYPSDQNCGGRMPVGSFEITDEQIDCISDWVEQFRD